MAGSRSLVHNAADEEQVRAGLKAVNNRKFTHIENLRVVLATEAGRDVLWMYVQKYFDTLSGPGSAEQLNFNEGQRELAGRIAKEVGEASPEALNAMLQKHFEAIQERNLKA